MARYDGYFFYFFFTTNKISEVDSPISTLSALLEMAHIISSWLGMGFHFNSISHSVPSSISICQVTGTGDEDGEITQEGPI